MRVTVVVPTYNGRGLLDEALESLTSQSAVAEIVVVDNASTDGTLELVHERYPDVRLMRNERNLGFGAAINRGALDLHTDVLVLVNNDVVCEPTFLEWICEPLADPRVGMVAGVLLQADAPDRIDTAGIELDTTLGAWDFLANEHVDRLAKSYRSPVGPCGGAAAYRYSAFRDAGGFDEALFAYWEDADLAIRLREAGWTCALARSARAAHRHGATIGPASPYMRRLSAFGRGYVLGKYGVPRTPAARLKIALLDWPVLMSHLVFRREIAPIRARREGLARGREHALRGRPPFHLATVSFGSALARHWNVVRLRLTRSLPVHFYERA